MSMNRREFVAMAPAFPAAAVTATLTLREDGKEPIDLDVSVLKVREGDTLVLSCSKMMTKEVMERIKVHVEHLFGGKVKAMVLTDELKVEGVLRVEP